MDGTDGDSRLVPCTAQLCRRWVEAAVAYATAVDGMRLIFPTWRDCGTGSSVRPPNAAPECVRRPPARLAWWVCAPDAGGGVTCGAPHRFAGANVLFRFFRFGPHRSAHRAPRLSRAPTTGGRSGPGWVGEVSEGSFYWCRACRGPPHATSSIPAGRDGEIDHRQPGNAPTDT